MSNAIKNSAPVQQLKSLASLGLDGRTEDNASEWPNGIGVASGLGTLELLSKDGEILSHHVIQSSDGRLTLGKVGGSTATLAAQRADDEGMGKQSTTMTNPADVAAIKLSIGKHSAVLSMEHGPSTSSIMGDTYGKASSMVTCYKAPTDTARPGVVWFEATFSVERQHKVSTPMSTDNGTPMFAIKLSYPQSRNWPASTTWRKLAKTGESTAQRHARIAAEF